MFYFTEQDTGSFCYKFVVVGSVGVIYKHYGAVFGPGGVHVSPICRTGSQACNQPPFRTIARHSLTHGLELLDARSDCEMLPVFTSAELPYHKQGDPDRKSCGGLYTASSQCSAIGCMLCVALPLYFPNGLSCIFLTSAWIARPLIVHVPPR